MSRRGRVEVSRRGGEEGGEMGGWLGRKGGGVGERGQVCFFPGKAGYSAS